MKLKVDLSLYNNSWYNPDSGQWEIEEMEYEIYVGSSSSMNDLQKSSFLYSANKAIKE